MSLMSLYAAYSKHLHSEKYLARYIRDRVLETWCADRHKRWRIYVHSFRCAHVNQNHSTRPYYRPIYPKI